MLTNEIVLKVFADYLKEDKEYEVILTSHGYTLMGWDDRRQDWNTSEFCPTPEALRDALLDSFSGFAEVGFTNGERDLTDAEEARIEAARQDFIEKCEKEAGL